MGIYRTFIGIRHPHQPGGRFQGYRLTFFYGLFVLANICCFLGCGAPPHTEKITGHVTVAALKTETPAFTYQDVFPGKPVGADFQRNEFYTVLQAAGEFHRLEIRDMFTGTVQKTIPLPSGDLQSPGFFSNPGSVAFLNGSWYLVDQFHKVIVFNQHFQPLYTSMFFEIRREIAFFSRNGQTCFFLQKAKEALNAFIYEMSLYELKPNEKPRWLYDFGKIVIHNNRIREKDDSKKDYEGGIWAAVDSFFQNGRVFYANGAENKLYIHDTARQTTETWLMDHLRPRRLDHGAAARFVLSKSDGWEEKYAKRFGEKIVYEAYPEPLFHFGLIKGGERTFGVIGEVDFERYTMRADLFDSVTMKYIKSIVLPFDGGLMSSLGTNVSRAAFIKTFLDAEQGIYIWFEDGEGPPFQTHLAVFQGLRARKRASQQDVHPQQPPKTGDK